MANNKYISLSGIMQLLRNIEDLSSVSLSQYTRRSLINTRAYIQDSVSESDIITPVIKLGMNLETGFIMTALQMNQFVTKTSTVRDMMGIVASESISTDEHYVSLDMAMESMTTMISPRDINQNIKKAKDVLDIPGNGTVKATSKGGIVDINTQSLPVHGRIIEMSFGKPNGENGPSSFTLYMYLNVYPTVIPDTVADAFVTTNITPAFGQRWIQMKTGEISFWKDLVLSADLVKNRRKALRADKTGVLSQMYNQQDSAATGALIKFAQLAPEKQNIASSMMIFDKTSFMRSCHQSGLNFSRFSDRQKFFNKAMALMVFLIDQEYNKADVYFHGLDLSGTYSFRDLKENAKNEKYDLMELMQAMNRGNLAGAR